jgi:hypothetical protein
MLAFISFSGCQTIQSRIPKRPLNRLLKNEFKHTAYGNFIINESPRRLTDRTKNDLFYISFSFP